MAYLFHFSRQGMVMFLTGEISLGFAPLTKKIIVTKKILVT